MVMHASATRTNTAEAIALLSRASPGVLRLLCDALASRGQKEAIERAFHLTQGQSPPRGLRAIAHVANEKSFECSTAYDMMFMQDEFFDTLANSLQGRYGLAYKAIRAAKQVAQQYRENDENDHLQSALFTLTLAAVVDLAGQEDA